MLLFRLTLLISSCDGGSVTSDSRVVSTIDSVCGDNFNSLWTTAVGATDCCCLLSISLALAEGRGGSVTLDIIFGQARVVVVRAEEILFAIGCRESPCEERLSSVC